MADRNDRNKNPRKELLIHDVPAALHGALDTTAEVEKISINEAAVRILSDHYKVKHSTPENGLRGHTGPARTRLVNPDSTKLTIRGGAKLHRKIAVDAARRDGTLRGVILEILCLHYDLPAEPIGRRPRQKENT